MRIDRLHIENFKKFAKEDFDFHPNFTLLVGDNGTGKTTVLDALAVAMAIWLVHPPDGMLVNSRRTILRNEIRLASGTVGDRIQFREMTPVVVGATGNLAGRDIDWTRVNFGPNPLEDIQDHLPDERDASQAIDFIQSLYKRDRQREKLVFPVLAYYGAGRAWLPSNKRPKPAVKSNGPARRWAAFEDCFDERIRTAKLQDWFLGEEIAAVNRDRQIRPGYEAVKRAVLRCVPGASKLWYDTDREQIAITIDGITQPFDNLSAGQRMMLALIADLAIKAVTQNAFLLPPDELRPEDNPLPRVLKDTPGIVLIDELDVHLHPKWQRHVATDLKETFPGIQFICTSHSPQVIGELKPEEIRILDGTGAFTPPRSFGIDSSRILEELMGASSRDNSVEKSLRVLFGLIDKEDFDGARKVLPEVEAQLGPDDPEITRARTLMTFLESTA